MWFYSQELNYSEAQAHWLGKVQGPDFRKILRYS